MPVFDAHIHVQPWWELTPAMLEVMTRGRTDTEELLELMKSPEQLLRKMDADGIERTVLVNYPSPDMLGFTERVNDYVAEYCGADPSRLIAMGGVHPRFTKDAGAEVRRAAELGVRALKVHPPHMGIAPNEYLRGLDALRSIYQEAERLRLPVMIHTGTSIFPGARSRCGEPMAVDDVAVDFPDLTIVMAHGGRPLWMDQAFFLVRRFPNVFMDVSSIPPKAVLRYFPRLLEIADKVLYGSDWPGPGVKSLAGSRREFEALDLPPDVMRKLLWDNACRVFGGS
ncbi:MAG TPA: amidohydrolase family protein [Vicinamibacteria bacterium]|nr:amidohydrolase family protein [Vicinamibacteria bacterium]